MQVTRHDSRQVTPFGHPGITARLTAPPGLSRPPTSFIGPWYQGIHRPPLPTYPQHTYTPTNRRTTNTKMLASTMQISTHHPPMHQNPPPHGSRPQSCQAPDNNHRPTPDPVVLSEPQQGARRPPRPAPRAPFPPHPAPRGRTPTHGRERRVVLDTPATKPAELHQCLHPRATPAPHTEATGVLDQGATPGQPLLRKEVIQPHLPVRLPCYDFVPIASPTFDGSPPHGLGHRLRVLPTFVT
jgi:hypothetical protein